MTTGKLLLIRHGESESNASLRTANAGNISLTAKGHAQSRAVAASLSVRPDLIVTSAFLRARQTAAPLCERYPDVPFETWAVQEYVYIDFGDTPTNRSERKPVTDAFWRCCDPLEKRGPMAESFVQFWNRCIDFDYRVRQFAGTHAGKHLVVFTHGYFIQAFQYGRHHGFGGCSTELMRAVHTWKGPDAYPNCCVMEHPLIEDPVMPAADGIDVASGAVYLGGALSNFSERTFVFDGVTCTAEGLLQSLKFDDLLRQQEVCRLVGREAKAVGTTRNCIWQRKQSLWWKGRPMDRNGKDYQAFLDTVYQAIAAQCQDFRDALLATGDAELTHRLGSSDPAATVLTSEEFCSRLKALRQALRHQ